MNQSKTKGSITITNVKDLKPKMAGSLVNIRGRLHTSRAKGKQCFFVVREQQETVQCLGFVNDRMSKQMVKFISHISKESIIDVQAEVVKASEKIESCTQQNIELHVHQVTGYMYTAEYRSACTPGNRIYAHSRIKNYMYVHLVTGYMYTAEYRTICTPGNRIYVHSRT